MQLLAEQKVDALVSSADTKAIMVLGRSILGTVQGLYRPAITKAFQGPADSFTCSTWARTFSARQIYYDNLAAWAVRYRRRVNNRPLLQKQRV